MNIKDCCSSFYVYKAAASCTQPLFSSVPSASGVESVVGSEQNVKLASIRQCSAASSCVGIIIIKFNTKVLLYAIHPEQQQPSFSSAHPASVSFRHAIESDGISLARFSPSSHTTQYTGWLTECQVNFVRKDHLIDNVSSLITGVITRAVIN